MPRYSTSPTLLQRSDPLTTVAMCSMIECRAHLVCRLLSKRLSKRLCRSQAPKGATSAHVFLNSMYIGCLVAPLRVQMVPLKCHRNGCIRWAGLRDAGTRPFAAFADACLAQTAGDVLMDGDVFEAGPCNGGHATSAVGTEQEAAGRPLQQSSGINGCLHPDAGGIDKPSGSNDIGEGDGCGGDGRGRKRKACGSSGGSSGVGGSGGGSGDGGALYLHDWSLPQNLSVGHPLLVNGFQVCARTAPAALICAPVWQHMWYMSFD